MVEILQGDVDVPVIGKTKKAYIYVPAALAAMYVAWRWYQASREAEPAPGADGLYSSPDLTEMGLSTTGGPTVIGGNTGSVVTDGTAPDAIDTNAEWTNKAAKVLSNAGYDPAVVYAALGEFLARRALDRDEATIARASIAAVGQPPVDRPWSVIEEATTGGTGKLAAPTGLRVTNTTPNSVSLTWSSVDGAGSYTVYQDFSSVGSTSGTSFTASGLSPHTGYVYEVAAVSTTGKTGSRSDDVMGITDPAPKSSTPTPKPKSGKGRHRTARISRRGQTLSDLVNEYNRKHGTTHTWQSIWDYNLRNRSTTTARTLRARGPGKVYIGSAFWFPI